MIVIKNRQELYKLLENKNIKFIFIEEGIESYISHYFAKTTSNDDIILSKLGYEESLFITRKK